MRKLALDYRHRFSRVRLALTGVQACHEFFIPLFRHRVEEVLIVAMVDEAMNLSELMAVAGNHNSVTVSTRVLIGRALEADASGIVVAHNHPMGKAVPSKNDIHFSRSLALGCEAVDIVLVDSLIYAGIESYSLRQHGYLDETAPPLFDWNDVCHPFEQREPFSDPSNS